jgi:hypothetical protein
MTSLLWLQDPRLKPLALNQSPAWVWSHDAKRVLWANPTAAALFDAPTTAALATRTFDDSTVAAVEVARLAKTLRSDGGARLERLRGFGAALAGRLTCACSRIALASGERAVLIVAIERSVLGLSLEQRVSRLLAACTEPIAVFAEDGCLLGATPTARRSLHGNMTLRALGADALTSALQAGGRADGACATGRISIERLGDPAAWIVTFEEPERHGPADEPAIPAGTASQTPRLSAAEHHAFLELSRQLARRINEADALSARAANANAPSKPRATPADKSGQPGTAIDSSDRTFLNELPIGVLVYRGQHLLYANPAFLTWAGCNSLDALAARGGLHSLTVEPGGSIAEQKDRQPFSVVSAHNESSFVDARVLRVPWNGEWVSALLTIPPSGESLPRASAKSILLTNLDHEVREPLTAITDSSEAMIQERFGPLGDQRYRQCLSDIQASAHRLLSVADDLRDLSKIEEGKLDLSFVSVSLNDAIRQCVANMQPQANREHVIIRTALSPALAPVVADPHSLHRILHNLLSASTAAAATGRQVIVSTAVTDIGDTLLRVRMIGGAANAAKPFSLVTATCDSGPGEIGVGLLLTKMLAEANHATFQIKRAPNEGIRVEIVFPRAQLLAAQ